METTLEFTRWTEKPRSVGYRRWAIAATGLRQLSRLKLARILLSVAWGGGLLMAVAGFSFSQTVASGGWLESAAAELGPRPQAVVSAFVAMLLLYPDIVVHGAFTSIFWAQSMLGLSLSLIALTVVVPRLVALDRASHALTIYLSRPLTSFDYLVGKFGIVLGVLLTLWTGPLLFGWLLSVLFAPDRVFVLYSLVPLLRALLFNAIGLVSLAAIAFGVSSLTRTARAATTLFVALWIFLLPLANFPGAPAWVRYASFSYDLRQVREAVFRQNEVLAKAGRELPLFNQRLSQNLIRVGEAARTDDTTGALAGLAVLSGLSFALFFRRLRPE